MTGRVNCGCVQLGSVTKEDAGPHFTATYCFPIGGSNGTAESVLQITGIVASDNAVHSDETEWCIPYAYLCFFIISDGSRT